MVRVNGLGFCNKPILQLEIRTFLLWVRGTSKNLKIFLRVPPKFWKKVVVLSGAGTGFCLRREAASAVERVAGKASVRFLRFF